MSTYRVTDSDGNVSRIEADEAFVKAQYASYELEAFPVRTDSEVAQFGKQWRDQELKDTDWVAQTPDHPQRDAYLTYRTKLRDWPSTGDFPDTRPTL